jgi:hypothetical protein
MSDMNLVIVFLRTLIITEQHGNDGDQVSDCQLRELPSETDDKGHDQEIGKIKQVFPGLYPLHIVHDDQVQVQIEYGYHPGKEELPPEIQMIGYDKDISGTEVDEGADIEAETEIGNDAYEMRDQYQQDKLVEPDRFFPFGRGIFLPDPGIDNILVKGSEKIDNRVAHRGYWRFKGFPRLNARKQ